MQKKNSSFVQSPAVFYSKFKSDFKILVACDRNQFTDTTTFYFRLSVQIVLYKAVVLPELSAPHIMYCHQLTQHSLII